MTNCWMSGILLSCGGSTWCYIAAAVSPRRKRRCLILPWTGASRRFGRRITQRLRRAFSFNQRVARRANGFQPLPDRESSPVNRGHQPLLNQSTSGTIYESMTARKRLLQFASRWANAITALSLFTAGCQNLEDFSLTYLVWGGEMRRRSVSAAAPGPHIPLFGVPGKSDFLVAHGPLKHAPGYG